MATAAAAKRKLKNAKHKTTKSKTRKDGVPNINKYLAMDADYQRTVNNLNTNLKSYNIKSKANQRNLTADYTTTRSRLNQQQGQDQKSEKSNFASRGLYGSGMQNADMNKLNTGYNQQKGDARVSFNRNKTSLLQDRADAGRLERQQAAEARAEAIRRRASQYSITGNPVAKPKAVKNKVVKPKKVK